MTTSSASDIVREIQRVNTLGGTAQRVDEIQSVALSAVDADNAIQTITTLASHDVYVAERQTITTLAETSDEVQYVATVGTESQDIDELQIVRTSSANDMPSDEVQAVELSASASNEVQVRGATRTSR